MSRATSTSGSFSGGGSGRGGPRGLAAAAVAAAGGEAGVSGGSGGGDGGGGVGAFEGSGLAPSSSGDGSGSWDESVGPLVSLAFTQWSAESPKWVPTVLPLSSATVAAKGPGRTCCKCTAGCRNM